MVAHNVGLLYQGRDEPRALQYLQLALRADRARHNTTYIASSLCNLASQYVQSPPRPSPAALTRAQDYLTEAQALHQKLGSRIPAGQQAFLQSVLGKLAERRGRWPEAISCYRRAEVGYRALALTQQHISALQDLAKAYQSNGQPATAWALAEQALAEARQAALPEPLRDAYRQLNDLSVARGDYQAAYTYQAQAQVQQDTLFNQRQAGELADLQLRYQTQQQSAQIDLLRRNTRLQQSRLALQTRNAALQLRGRNLLLLTLLTMVLGVTVHGVMAVRGYRRQRRSIALLQAQEVELATKNNDLTSSQQQLRKLLGEKDVLLKEVHHRVKNNLQIVSSMLALQAFDKQDALPRLGVALRESQNWVRAIALIHETLYRSDNLVRLDFEPFLRQLAAALAEAFNAGGTTPLVSEVAAPGVQLNTSTAVPLGLIANELLTNVYKHAFTAGAARRHVRLDLVPGPGAAHYTLTVEDNGRGLPPAFDINQAASLGLSLVQRLAEQLDGHLHLSSTPGHGTRCTIVFREISESVLPL